MPVARLQPVQLCTSWPYYVSQSAMAREMDASQSAMAAATDASAACSTDSDVITDA